MNAALIKCTHKCYRLNINVTRRSNWFLVTHVALQARQDYDYEKAETFVFHIPVVNWTTGPAPRIKCADSVMYDRFFDTDPAHLVAGRIYSVTILSTDFPKKDTRPLWKTYKRRHRTDLQLDFVTTLTVTLMSKLCKEFILSFFITDIFWISSEHACRFVNSRLRRRQMTEVN
ncbi:hypothetical protein J6590_005856 [Homalodisca vitripennis]|nr:hypothetical protein J6590_005856 [Homalodisca vitripennis]